MNTVLPALEDGVTVVTATNRLARNLALAYNRRQQADGRRAWRTPAILPWQAWIEQFWSMSIPAGAAADGQMLLTQSQQAAVWRGIAIEAGAAPLPWSEAPLAALAMTAWRMCQDWRISESELANAADSPDTLTFADWASRYRKKCNQMGWLDAGMLPALVARDLQRGLIRPPPRVCLLGFDDWAPLQQEFLRVAAMTGCEIRAESAPRVDGARANSLNCRDRHHEIDCAARWARQRRETDSGSAVAVIVPDLAARLPEVRRAFLDVLAPDWRLSPGRELPVNFSFGQPLGSIGLAHAALLLLRGLGGSLDYRDAGQLLRSPYLAASGPECGARASLEIACRERPATRIQVAELAAMADRAGAPAFAAQMLSLCTTSAAMPPRQLPGQWAATFSAALRGAGWPGDRGLGSDEYQAATSWQELLDQFCACDRISGDIDLEDSLKLLAILAREQIFQPSGDDTAIQVMGALEALGQQFDALWICGMSSANWPPATRPSPLLPLSLQRRLRMPGASAPAVRERAERLLRWLESSAPEVVVSWPEFHGEEPISPSPLIEHLPRADPDTLRFWHGARNDQLLVRARATETLLDDPPPPIDPGELPLAGGAALLARQARCPARAFLEFRLGARELRDPVMGLDAAARGSVMHAVLQEFFRRVSGHEQLLGLGAEAQATLLDELIAVQLRRVAPPHDPFMRALAREERARLGVLLTAFLQTEREREPFRVLGTEQVVSMSSAPEALLRLQLTLRIDRVDESSDGRRLVIDYKTGRKLPSLSEIVGPRPRSPQLPLYAIATDADAVAFLRISSGDICWAGVGRGTWNLDGVLSPADLTNDPQSDWGSLRGSWWSAIDRLAQELLAGDYRVDRWKLEDAQGQWAMATRVHELPESGTATT